MRILMISWASAVLLVAFFDSSLRARLWIMVIGVWVMLAILGVALLVSAVNIAKRRMWATQPTINAAIPVGVLTWLVVFWPALSWTGDQVVFRARFAVLRPKYEQIVNQVGRGNLSIEGQFSGIQYFADRREGLRIAFPQPGGILDNWEGVIYDPSNEVSKAKGWNGGPGNFSAPPNIRSLFGGDLLKCQHIGGPYHRCWFT